MNTLVKFRLKNLLTKDVQFSEIFLGDGVTLAIGRSIDDVSLLLDDPNVSRVHAQVTLKDNRLYIEDLDSHNGIKYQGRKVQKLSLELNDSCIIGVFKVTFIQMGEEKKHVDKKALVKSNKRKSRKHTEDSKLKVINEDSTGIKFIYKTIINRYKKLLQTPKDYLITTNSDVYPKTEYTIAAILGFICFLPIGLKILIFENNEKQIQGLETLVGATILLPVLLIIYSLLTEKTKGVTKVKGETEDYVHFASVSFLYLAPVLLIGNFISSLPFVGGLAPLFSGIAIVLMSWCLFLFYKKYSPIAAAFFVTSSIYIILCLSSFSVLKAGISNTVDSMGEQKDSNKGLIHKINKNKMKKLDEIN